MNAQKISLTENENALIIGIVDNEYSDGDYDAPAWVFAALDTADLNPKIGRGVLSSLVKKGLAVVGESDAGMLGVPLSETIPCNLTASGIAKYTELTKA